MLWRWPDALKDVTNVPTVPTRSQSILSKLGKISQELTVEKAFQSWEWKAWSPLPVSFSRCDSELTAAGILLGVDYSVVTVQLKFVFLPDISR